MLIKNIDKRVPFGFRGDWGLLYKQYNFATEITLQEKIIYQETTYYDLGMDVQFKPLEDGIVKRSTSTDEKVEKKRQTEDYRIVQTTDAYFDEETNEYECIVEVGDIIKLFGRYWVVENIEEECVYSPAKQSFYNIGMTRIANEEIITNQPE